MEDPIEVVDSKITLRYKLEFLHLVKEKLDDPRNVNRKELFLGTIFGKWLDFPPFSNDNLLLNYILHHQVKAKPLVDCPPIPFCISGNRFEFGCKEFCLVTGFRFGKLPKPESQIGLQSSEFLERILPDKVSHAIKKVTGDELMPFLEEDEKWFLISDADSIRICLLLVATIVFMGHRSRNYIPDNILELVEDLTGWDNYPWGEYFWTVFYKRILNVIKKKNERHLKKIEENVVEAEPEPKKRKLAANLQLESKPVQEPAKKTISYNLCGFGWALKIFVLELFPTSNKWWRKDPKIVPRCLRWSFAAKFAKSDLPELFAESTNPELMSLIPTDYEAFQPWFVDSMEYFKYLQEFDQRKREKRLQVQVVPSDPCEECDDNSQSMSKDDALCEFEAIQSTVVSIDSRKEDAPSNELLKELEVVKQRLCSLEQAIKVTYTDTSEGSVKQRSSKSDCAVSDVVHQEIATETQAIVAQSSVFINMDTPHTYNMTPLFEDGKDVMDETQNDWPIPNLNDPFSENEADYPVLMSPGSKEFGSDDEQNTVLSNMVDSISINERSAHATDIINPSPEPIQSISPCTLEVGNKVTLQDNPVKMDLPSSAQQIFTVLKRYPKKGKYRRPPYTPLPKTTPVPKKRKSKRLEHALPMPPLDDDCQIILPKYWVQDESPAIRKRHDILDENKKKVLEVDGPDFELLAVEPWVEDLSRAPDCHKSNVTMPAFIDQILKMGTDTGHVFPWSRKGHGLGREEWLSLLGRSKRGWLSSKHLDIWCDLMWHFRPVDADWAIAGPYFCSFVMRGDLPLWVANGVKYPVPWTQVNRVMIPINEPDIHYCLGVLDIMTGVIKLYDSLPIPSPENRDWWKKMRCAFADILPSYLEKCGVFKAKSICPETYKIKFEVEENVPVQREGDCLIWVCILLHRLSQNLPISTGDDPVQTGLAYREHMADYLWKYRILEDRLKSIDDFA